MSDGGQVIPRLQIHVPTAPLSTFGIGGIAEIFIRVKNPEELVETAKAAAQIGMPYRVFAAGSNIVFRDRKVHGVLIQFLGGKLEFQGTACTVDAGVTLEKVIDKAVAAGLKGLETLSGIPGSVGGAVVGNAGAYGHSISEVVEKVEIWDGKARRWISNPQCHFAYRESVFKQKRWAILRVVLRFTSGKPAELRKISRDIVSLRLKKYKPGLRCPGSFFKNVLVKDVSKSSLCLIDPSKIIEGKIPAGYLLEQVGANGMKRHGIEVAKFHGNLFINRGGGMSEDVRHLAAILKGRVKKKFGIDLEEEVRYF